MERTPGPWYWDDGGYGEDCDPPEPGKRWISIYDDDDSEVCVIVNRTGSFSSNQFANARLIAATPELLEAAEEVLANWSSGDLAAAVRELDAAVKKAKEG